MLVNDLVVKLSERVQVSAFVNDLAVWVTNHDARMSCRELQWPSAEVSSWCLGWLMPVVIEKCSVTLFSMNRSDAEMRELIECVEEIKGGDLEWRRSDPLFPENHLRCSAVFPGIGGEGGKEGHEECWRVEMPEWERMGMVQRLAEGDLYGIGESGVDV